jgi:type VI secretion system secreted protein Hcp
MAIDAFLKIDTINGEATDDKLKDTFHIKSGSFGVRQKGTAVTGTGLGAGKAEFDEFTFTIDTQFGSPALIKACAAGTHIKSATLYVRKAGGTPQVFLTYRLDNVMISSYVTSLEEESSDTVTLNFVSLFAEYKKQDEKGNLGTASKGGWDLKLNKEVTA